MIQQTTMENINEEYMLSLLTNMLKYPEQLQKGDDILNKINKCNGFITSLIMIAIQTNKYDVSLRKLAGTISLKQLNNVLCIYNDSQEIQTLFVTLAQNITPLVTQDYYTQNYVAHVISKIISFNVTDERYISFINVLLNDIVTNINNNNLLDVLLRILLTIVKECDDTISSNTNVILSTMISIYNKITNNTKNKEKVLLIIHTLMMHISYADGTDTELITNQLLKDNMLNTLITLLSSIISFNPKITKLADIKRIAVNILTTLIEDFPILSEQLQIPQHILECICTSYVNTTKYYFKQVIINQNETFTNDEINYMINEQCDYTRGYESDNDNELYGLNAYIIRLTNLMNVVICDTDSIVISNIIPIDAILKILMSVKIYLLLPIEQYTEMKNDPESAINIINDDFDYFRKGNEYDEIQTDIHTHSVRKANSIFMKEITYLLISQKQNELTFNFAQMILSEMLSTPNADNYKAILYDNDILNLLNEHNKEMLQETNFYILGHFADDVYALHEMNMLNVQDIQQILEMLVNNVKGNNIIISCRALWALTTFKEFYASNTNGEYLHNIIVTVIEHLITNVKGNMLYTIFVGCNCLYELYLQNTEKQMNVHIQHKNALYQFVLLIMNNNYISISKDNFQYILKGLIAITNFNKDIALLIINNFYMKLLFDIYYNEGCDKVYEHNQLFMMLIHELKGNIDAVNNALMLFCIVSGICLQRMYNAMFVLPDVEVNNDFILNARNVKFNDESVGQLLKVIQELLDGVDKECISKVNYDIVVQVTNIVIGIALNSLDNIVFVQDVNEFLLCYTKVFNKGKMCSNEYIERYLNMVTNTANIDNGVKDSILRYIPQIIAQYYCK